MYNQIMLPLHKFYVLRLMFNEKTVVYVILFWHVIKELELRLNEADWACSTRFCQRSCTHAHAPPQHYCTPAIWQCVSTEHESADELKMREKAKCKQ